MQGYYGADSLKYLGGGGREWLSSTGKHTKAIMDGKKCTPTDGGDPSVRLIEEYYV